MLTGIECGYKLPTPLLLKEGAGVVGIVKAVCSKGNGWRMFWEEFEENHPLIPSLVRRGIG